MPNVKFTQMPVLPAANVTAGTIAPVVTAGVNYQVSIANLQTYLNNNNSGVVTAAGFAGSGAQLSNIAGANVTGVVPSATGAVTANTAGFVTGNAQANITSVGVLTALSVSGNIQGNYILGNGSQLTGLPATYGNANVAAYLPTNTANVGAGNVSATGNIAGTFFLGNGSQLTGLPATYGNANVAAYLSSGTVTANIVTSGHVYAGNAATVIGNIDITNGSLNIANGRINMGIGNITSGNIAVTGTVSATGNITGNFFVGNGSQLTGIVGTYGNANVAGFLGAFGSNAISTTGNVTSGSMFVGNVISAAGNITGSFVLGNGSAMTGTVTRITAGSGISINSATGNVTITNTGGGGGGGSNIANGTSNVSIPVASGNIDVFVANTRKLTINSASGNFTGVIANTGIQCNSLFVTTGGITSNNGSIQVVGNAVAGEFLEATGFGFMSIGASTSGGANGNISIFTAGNVSIAASRTLDISGSANVKIPFVTKTGTSTGLPGMITVDSNYIYVCTSSNVWKRAALSSF
jgi:hypothetical protein